uniref:Uncharacterized protein n=1 Tax=Rhizophora mucronata TaxID=61149 RepID=A0A2P2IU89_RHIMU
MGMGTLWRLLRWLQWWGLVKEGLRT